VLKHHRWPGREDFRQHFLKEMPKILGAAQPTPAAEMRYIIDHSIPQTWNPQKARLLALLENLS
jgi:hypothetical protein